MKQNLMPIAEPSLVDKTLDRLMDLIIVQRLKKLPPQSDLAVQFRVSRTVLREALSKLEFLNICVPRAKTGTVVNPPNKWKTTNHEVINWQKRF